MDEIGERLGVREEGVLDALQAGSGRPPLPSRLQRQALGRLRALAGVERRD